MTKFQQKVYNMVRSIKRGQTLTYAGVAKAVGRPWAYRAVGNALNKAPTRKLVGIKRNSSEAEYRLEYILLRQGFAGLFSPPSSDQQVGRYSAKENKNYSPDVPCPHTYSQ